MLQGDHQDLHKELNDFLSQKDDGFGHDMWPRNGNTGDQIQENFSREELLKAMGEFYNTNWDNWPDAADDFFKQWPALDQR
jgi:hypothetical protein